jgi:hypothetical protein
LGIQEERRLFYVALTRAQKRLYLTWPATRILYRVIRDVAPSRFVWEIPETLWDGPVGRRDQEKKAAFLGDFFANLQSTLDDA